MLCFKPLEISDKPIIEKYVATAENLCCTYYFNINYLWKSYRAVEFAIVDDFLLYRCRYPDGVVRYTQPIGEGDFSYLIPLLEEDASSLGKSLTFEYLTKEGKELIKEHYPDFGFWEERSVEDYIYSAESMRTLSGHHLKCKRTMVHHFANTYNYTYKTLDVSMRDECMSLYQLWGNHHGTNHVNIHETHVKESAFEHFDQLGLCGGALYVDQKMVAFVMGSEQNHHTFCLHIEKANIDYQGCFVMVHNSFFTHLSKKYTLVNLEDDLGLKGLRQMKMSYQPQFLQKAYVGCRINSTQRMIQELWKESFGDDDLFIDQFLINHYSEENSFLHIENGELLSMLFLIPMDDTVYLYGVTTKKEYRGKKLFTNLLNRAIVWAKQKGYVRMTLIPAEDSLVSLYERFGFNKTDKLLSYDTLDEFDFGSSNPENDYYMEKDLLG